MGLLSDVEKERTRVQKIRVILGEQEYQRRVMLYEEAAALCIRLFWGSLKARGLLEKAEMRLQRRWTYAWGIDLRGNNI